MAPSSPTRTIDAPAGMVRCVPSTRVTVQCFVSRWIGRLDITECARHWLLDEDGNQRPEISHLCWDGCMFPNATLEQQETWNTILAAMQDINKAHG